MLVIKTNTKLEPEKQYIVDILFGEFLGLDYQLIMDDISSGFNIRLSNGSQLQLNDEFWNQSQDNYLSPSSLPKVSSLMTDFAPHGSLPVLYGESSIESAETFIHCGFDLLGACFFMLSRMEEAIVAQRDAHQRFSARSSVAYQQGFLDRPIVDEYTETLWAMLIKLDSSLVRKTRQARQFVTCDVDWPFDPNRRSFKKTLIQSISDVVHRRDIKGALSSWKFWLFHTLGLSQADEYRDSIDWMMEVNEQVGNKVSFYFITQYTSPIDSEFDFDSKPMRQLFNSISNRGHYIGLHPGYQCYNNATLFEKSASKLKQVLADEGIEQPELGGRMHLLRWDILQTPQLWEENNFNYDSTLCFADMAGFRCGTSQEFSMFDLKARKKMRLKQRPLINMECTIIADRYEGLGYSAKALQRFNYFKETCKTYNGNYTLLWHNSHFGTENDRSFYQQIIKVD